MKLSPSLLKKMEGAVQTEVAVGTVLQLATLALTPPKGSEWLHEIKLDGYRLLAIKAGNSSKILTRNGNNWTARFPQLAKAITGLPCENAMLDGEAVVLDKNGVSRFQKLQNALGDERMNNVVFFSFDLLRLDGYDLTACPLLDRKAVLKQLLLQAESHDRIKFNDHVLGGGDSVYAEACRMGLEGIVSKLADAPYQPGRSRSWLKVKSLQRQEFVIVGFTDAAGIRKGIGALLLGVFEGDKILYCGKVGTGFSAKLLNDLYRKFKPLEQDKPPVANPPRGAQAKGIHWMKPETVAEISFAEWTAEGSVRHPSFQGLRQDKPAHEVTRERPAAQGLTPERPAAQPVSPTPKPVSASSKNTVAGVTISHPEKVLFPDVGITKLDLALYYEKVAPWAVPALNARPLTLLRCPEGFEKGCFFQKHAVDMPKGIPRVKVDETEDGQDIYLMVDGLPSLIELVQMGVLEFHVWGAKAGALETPDIVVFDLDPGPAVDWKDVKITAIALRERLSKLGLESYPRFTGGKGLHVVVPLMPRASWEQVKTFSLNIAEEFVRKAPRSLTAKLAKQGRESKILIDYLRNGRGATAVASYSVRARAGAPVALPVRWNDVEASDKPLRLSPKEAPVWLAKEGRGESWKGFDESRRVLTKKILSAVGVPNQIIP